MLRVSSTALTGGIGNPVVSTIEAASSFILSVLAIFVPILAVGLVVTGVTFLIQKVLQKRANLGES
jgi:hypothetical protein